MERNLHHDNVAAYVKQIDLLSLGISEHLIELINKGESKSNPAFKVGINGLAILREISNYLAEFDPDEHYILTEYVVGRFNVIYDSHEKEKIVLHDCVDNIKKRLHEGMTQKEIFAIYNEHIDGAKCKKSEAKH